MRLGLQLLAHRTQGEDSPYWQYIRNLPSRFDGIPMFFPADSVAALQYPPVTEQVGCS